MPLPSSGNQIALSQIRNEFGLGSGQIAMSQLYGKGNAPASSGAIELFNVVDTFMVYQQKQFYILLR
jgi:hypothetical protein